MIKDKRKMKVFISYARKNKELVNNFRNKFDDHLKASLNFDYEIWQDVNIKLGSEWEEDILSAIRKSDIAILLVSPTFLSSDYISNTELPLILKHVKKVIPVALGKIDFEYHDLHGLNKRQFYFLNVASFSKPRSYTELNNKRREDFVFDLFKHIEKSLGNEEKTG